MAGLTTAFWEFTINNYTPTDIALLQQGYPDQLRQLVYSREIGEDGTPHIQGYVRLLRQQRLSYVRKLFPRAHFKAITCEVYNLNAQRYPQKQDDTSDGHVVISNNAFPDPITELLEVIDEAMGDDMKTEKELAAEILATEFTRVIERPARAKFYVSAVYTKVKERFLHQLIVAVRERRIKENEAHTHTHTQDETSSECSNITDEAPQRKIVFSSSIGAGSDWEDGQDHEEGSCEEDGGSTEGSGSTCGEDSDGSRC
ncbi:hypothetical protein [Candidatus Magnetobacterium casense]|uniref:CRESS-DNA virus Rep endonuclease domain-containing protein n=1 Tax=Candidatus Magnetobacterium casense TaxID=1455061 RepID=A0ABS6S3I3_9BACT|nr:hypothetical protein [Candidatus Magnetobacterium casensis]MBV6343414.1 hypothetical protein [Candidatus Magnetobacterium casensis]